MLSEEDEDVIVGNPEGKYGIAFDPLDGFASYANALFFHN